MATTARARNSELCCSQVSDTVDSALREAHNHTDSRQGITLEEFERLLLSDRDNTLELYDTRLAKRQNPA
jgi:hypothetical protein